MDGLYLVKGCPIQGVFLPMEGMEEESSYRGQLKENEEIPGLKVLLL